MTAKLQTIGEYFTGGNLAFVVVVTASFVSAATVVIYSRRSLPGWEVALLVATGAAYLVIGTYGFAICRRSELLLVKLAYFLIQSSLAAILLASLGSSRELSLILLPLAGQSALVLSRGLMIPVCALIYLTLAVQTILLGRWLDASIIALVHGTGIVFVVVFMRVAASEREARTKLAQANHQLRERAAQIEDLATTKERNRLAREIHDSLGHYLTVVNVQIKAAQTILAHDRPRALDHLAKAQTLTQEGLAEVRRSVAALRASPIESRPLPEALANLAEQWKAAGVRTQFAIVGTIRRLTPQASLALYRAAQEALTNVGKHAQASTVDIRLEYGNQLVRLRVRDDGVGSDRSEGGFGLLGARERVQLLNGELHVRTAPGEGFSLTVELPA